MYTLGRGARRARLRSPVTCRAPVAFFEHSPMTAASQSDLGVQYLADKLSLLTRKQSEASRNAALDILTGRTPTHDPLAQWSPIAPMTNVAPARGRAASPWLAVALGVAAAAALAAGFAFGALTHPAASQPSGTAAGYATNALTRQAPSEPSDTAAPISIEHPPAGLGLAPGGSAAVPATPAAPAPAAGSDAAPLAQPHPAAAAPQPATTLRLLLDESFIFNEHHWPDDPNGTAWFASGAYHLAAKYPTHFVAIGIPGATDLQDSVLTAVFHKRGGPTGGGYGLIVRARDDEPLDGTSQLGHYYVFEVGDTGTVGVWLRDGERWVDLLSWSASDAVHPATAANELTVTAIGDRLSFQVNGIPVASQIDQLLHAGTAGVFVGGDGNQVSLDRMTVRIPS